MKHKFISIYQLPRFKCEEVDPFTPLSVGTDIVGGLINNIFNRSNMKKQNEYNKGLLQMQNDFTETMWNKSNSYNDPSAVRDRMVNAGLNPILLGEGVSGAPATAVSSGFGGSASLPASTMQLQNPQLVAAQIENIKADTTQKEASALLTDAQKTQVQQLNDLRQASLHTDKEVAVHENLLKLAELTEQIRGATECPQAIRTAYKDAWMTISQTRVNGEIDWVLKQDEINNLRPQQRAQLEESVNLLKQQISSIPIELALTRRGQDIDKYKAQLSASVQKWCKSVDKQIAQISAAAHIRSSEINAGFSKAMVDMFSPVFKLGKGQIDKIVSIAADKGLSAAWDYFMSHGSVGGPSVGAW